MKSIVAFTTTTTALAFAFASLASATPALNELLKHTGTFHNHIFPIFSGVMAIDAVVTLVLTMVILSLLSAVVPAAKSISIKNSSTMTLILGFAGAFAVLDFIILLIGLARDYFASADNTHEYKRGLREPKNLVLSKTQF